MYSFGLLLQEIFTGRRPYDATLSTPELLDRARRGESLEPTGLSAVKYTIDLSRERTAAVAARDEADRRRDQAESLVGFLLGDLRKKLEPVGRLRPLAPPRRDWRQEVAYANSNIASVLEARGDLVGALARYRASLAIEAALLAAAPADAALIRSVASSHNAIAVVLRASGDLDGADAELAAERAILERMAEAEPANATWQHRLAVNLSLAGELLAARGQRGGAREILERALGITVALVDRDGGNSTWRRELARIEFKLGRLFVATAAARAVTLTTRAANTLGTLVEKDPTNAGWQRDWAEARHGVGVALLARGGVGAAARPRRPWPWRSDCGRWRRPAAPTIGWRAWATAFSGGAWRPRRAEGGAAVLGAGARADRRGCPNVARLHAVGSLGRRPGAAGSGRGCRRRARLAAADGVQTTAHRVAALTWTPPSGPRRSPVKADEDSPTQEVQHHRRESRHLDDRLHLHDHGRPYAGPLGLARSQDRKRGVSSVAAWRGLNACPDPPLPVSFRSSGGAELKALPYDDGAGVDRTRRSIARMPSSPRSRLSSLT
jgi:tetratricopeptide (TPR) repeat protein